MTGSTAGRRFISPFDRGGGSPNLAGGSKRGICSGNHGCDTPCRHGLA
jgi:hypothetical protein